MNNQVKGQNMIFKFRNILYFSISIPVFIILIWLFAVPGSLIQERIEEAISSGGRGNITASMTGFKKGLFFSVSAESLDLKMDKVPALKITGLTARLDPQYLIKMQFAFEVKGKIGSGEMRGLLKFPSEGEIKIERAELDEIPYLGHIGIQSSSYITADISIKDRDARLAFTIPELAIEKAAILIPFMDSFHKAQGVLSITGDEVKVDSVSLEGEKGYARLKGDITNRVMNLSLEVMPYMNRLNATEAMLIGKFFVSPGYFVIPVKGPLL